MLEPLQSNYFHSTSDFLENARSSQTSEIWYKSQGPTTQGQAFSSSSNNHNIKKRKNNKLTITFVSVLLLTIQEKNVILDA